jgi:hypothetical protein
MIRIKFIEPNTENWKQWTQQCKEKQLAHNDAIEQGKSSEVSSHVYKGERYKIKFDVFINPKEHFYGKCAFCESLIAADQPGDIEHFRPKNEVRDINNVLVMINTKDGPKQHPGYYWLAYNWQNLLPSCSDCNSITKQKTGGDLIGKGTRFPITNSYAILPGEEKDENPLLINPAFEDPEDHLEVDKTGVIKEKNNSPKGKTCIEIFGLNKREALLEGRNRAYDATKNQLSILALALSTRNPAETANQMNRIEKMLEGKEPYSLACRAAFKDSKKDFEPLIKLFNNN